MSEGNQEVDTKDKNADGSSGDPEVLTEVGEVGTRVLIVSARWSPNPLIHIGLNIDNRVGPCRYSKRI